MVYPHQSGRSSVAVVMTPVKGCEWSRPAFVKLAWNVCGRGNFNLDKPRNCERSRVVLEGVR
jgi:hypothetical protein